MTYNHDHSRSINTEKNDLSVFLPHLNGADPVVSGARLLEHCALEELVDVLDPIVSAAAKLSRDAWISLGFGSGFAPRNIWPLLNWEHEEERGNML